MPEYRIEFKRAAKKYLVSLERKTQIRIINAIKGLAQFPPVGDLKPLEGRDGKYRLRVGGYRVIFSYGKDGEIIIVMIEDIGPRGDIYK